jgi:hypothetical protein
LREANNELAYTITESSAPSVSDSKHLTFSNDEVKRECIKRIWHNAELWTIEREQEHLIVELTSTTSTIATALKVYSQKQTTLIPLKYTPGKNTPVDCVYDELVDDVVGFLKFRTTMVKKNTQCKSDDNV